MPRKTTSGAKKGGSTPKEAKAGTRGPTQRSTAPAPEVTNFEHPAAAGTRAVVPGAGVVSAGADAFPKETSDDLGRGGGGAPGAGPCNAPNTAPEARSPDGETRLNPPTPGTDFDDRIDAGTAHTLAEDVPGINDPNYSAAKYSDKTSDREARKGGRVARPPRKEDAD